MRSIAKIRIAFRLILAFFAFPRFLCVFIEFSSIVVAGGFHVRSSHSPNNYWSVWFITTDNTPYINGERIRVAHVLLIGPSETNGKQQVLMSTGHAIRIVCEREERKKKNQRR